MMIIKVNFIDKTSTVPRRVSVFFSCLAAVCQDPGGILVDLVALTKGCPRGIT